MSNKKSKKPTTKRVVSKKAATVKKAEVLILKTNLAYSQSADTLPKWFPKDTIPAFVLDARSQFADESLSMAMISAGTTVEEAKRKMSVQGVCVVRVRLWNEWDEIIAGLKKEYKIIGIMGYDEEEEVFSICRKHKIPKLYINEKGKLEIER